MAGWGPEWAEDPLVKSHCSPAMRVHFSLKFVRSSKRGNNRLRTHISKTILTTVCRRDFNGARLQGGNYWEAVAMI